MFDMSWGEVLVIGAVALIVIGPKDLPKALRTVGNMTAKMRRMASEFQSQFNEAMREAELDDIKKEVAGLNQSVASLNTGFNPIQTIRDEIKGAIESDPPSPAAGTPSETPAPAAALPGEPAFDLALPAPEQASPPDAGALAPPAPEVRPESAKA